MEKEVFSTNGIGTTRYLHRVKNVVQPLSHTTHRETNSTWITDLYMKVKTRKILAKKHRQNFCGLGVEKHVSGNKKH